MMLDDLDRRSVRREAIQQAVATASWRFGVSPQPVKLLRAAVKRKGAAE